MLNIIQNRKIFFSLSGILVVGAVVALVVWGLQLGIDFNGGSLMELSFKETRPGAREVVRVIEESELDLGEVKVQPSGDQELLLRSRTLSEDEHQALLNILANGLGGKMDVELMGVDGEGQAVTTTAEVSSGAAQEDVFTENRFESIGPVIGQELKSKAVVAITIALAVIILYIAYTFRKISKPVASWKYGISAIIALAHDILIITGVFAALGHFLNVEVGILFVTALLTVLGYSVNDTIVVFDRVRENLIYRPKETFVETVNASVNETITRSINTSLTTLLVLFSLYFLGGTSIREFILVLILGAIVGTYSSIFVASPLLVVWQKLTGRKK